MLDRVLNLLSIKTWKLQGYDTFAGEWYPLPGRYFSEKAAQRAARRELKKLEKMQPSRYSGGQRPGGIQDRVYIVGPDGLVVRYLPEE
jgi:hypothetical protein